MKQIVIEDFNDIEKYKDKLKEIKIWVCSPATGKSYLCGVDNRFFDLDVYLSKLPNDENLENQIIFKMFEIINDGRIVTNASHTFFVNYLSKNNIPYCYVYAKPEAEDEYRQRMLRRGSGQEFVNKFGNIAERYAYKVKDKKPTFKIELKQKEYLSDYLWRIFGKPKNYNELQK